MRNSSGRNETSAQPFDILEPMLAIGRQLEAAAHPVVQHVRSQGIERELHFQTRFGPRPHVANLARVKRFELGSRES